MSTMETATATHAARMLIDARLDAIDRALLGRVSREERLDVVGEVESRIDEMLREHCDPGVEPSREDVLSVLSRLDPPEAYLADDGPRPARSRLAPDSRPSLPAAPGRPSPNGGGRISQASGICGIVSILAPAMIPCVYVMAAAISSEIALVVGALLLTVLSGSAGVTAIALACVSRLGNAWAVAGFIQGVFGCVVSTILLVGYLLTL